MKYSTYQRRISEYLGRRSRLAIVAAGLACTALLAFIDFATGYELSFSLFYVAPIAFVAWYGGWKAALLLSIASAVAWEEANRLAGQVYSTPAIPVWNTVVRLGFFLIIAGLLLSLRRRLEREQALSRTDSLTGIKNRRGFEEQAQAELARVRRTARALTVAYIDLDDFKGINDRLGHEAGDRLLRVVATTLRSNCRITDTVARLGGDEFGLLLPETSDEAAGKLMAKMHQALREEMRIHQWQVGFSMGVLTCRSAPETVDAMVRLTDQLMYRAKTSGKNALITSVYAG